MTNFLPIAEFAKAQGVTARAVEKAIAKTFSGNSFAWRGQEIELQVLHGRGGRSGVQYAVKVDSLPGDLKEHLKGRRKPLEDRSPAPRNVSARERNWWLHTLAEALKHPKGSAERKAAFEAIAAKPVLDWEGRSVTISVRTLQRRAAKIEREQNVAALARRRRSDRGKSRVIISRAWDDAVPFDDATKREIAESLQQEIRGLIKGGMAGGHILTHARQFLIETTKIYGFRPNDAEILERACAIPKRRVEDELHYRKVFQYKRDRKAFENDKPRIQRGNVDRPMELVVADVHPIDIHLLREDGTVATPKLLGFMDCATQRVYCELIFFENRTSMPRAADVIEAFAAMAEHPAFGLPENLYIDNGKEYLFADFLDDAMKLNVPDFSLSGSARQTQIIRALPYNAAAKAIEGWFGRFESRYLSALPGHIGGDRMNKKERAPGKTVAPFGTFEEFKPVFYGLLRAYEKTPQGKNTLLKGLSPAAAFLSHVQAGWAATVMSRDEIRAACARTEERAVKQGAISVRNRIWTCEELWTYPHDKVLVRIPAYHAPAELLLLDLNGERLGIARPDVEFHPLDPRGAKASASRARAHKDAIRKLDRSAPDIDVAARLIAHGGSQPEVTPNPPNGVVTFDPSTRPPRMAEPRRLAEPADEDGRRKNQELLEIMRPIMGKQAS